MVSKVHTDDRKVKRDNTEGDFCNTGMFGIDLRYWFSGGTETKTRSTEATSQLRRCRGQSRPVMIGLQEQAGRASVGDGE